MGSISVKLRDKTVELDIPRTLWIVFEVQCKDKLSPRHLPVAHPKLQIPKAATFSGERANRYYQRPEYWFRGYLPSSRIDLNLLCDRSGKGSRYLEAMHRQTSAVVEILPNTLAHEARVSIIPSTEGLAIVHGDSPQWYDFLGNFSRLASIG